MADVLRTARRASLELSRTRPTRDRAGRGASPFWSGPWGLVVTSLVLAVLAAMLVGWVLVWARDDDGPNALWLTLGPLAFSAVVVIVAMQLWSLRASQRLRQAEVMFLTGASHNLRTPLSAIRAAAQTLSSPTVGEADRRLLLEAILHESTRLELRVDNLLETARIDLEQKSYAAGASAIDIGALVHDVHDEARWAFAARGGTFEVALPDEPLFVAGDQRALRLLFENLVDNALKYSAHAPRVTTTVTRSAEHAVVRVRDHGMGFVAQQGDDLFERPAIGDSRRRGAGLGLRLARAIARGHGGGLTIASEGPEQGATAEVWLPLDEE